MPLQAPPCKRLPEDRGSLEEPGGEEGLDGAVDRACGDHLSRRRRLLRQLSATSIHRSAWKVNSAKFGCSILYSSRLSGRILPFHPGPKHSSQHYMLWRWIGMHNLVSRSALSAADNNPTQ